VRRVATYVLSSHYMTEQSVTLLLMVLAGSLSASDDLSPPVYFKLVDNSGNVVIDPSDRAIAISPEMLKLRFRDTNLGQGDYSMRDEPI